jgi:hypothetical protein
MTHPPKHRLRLPFHFGKKGDQGLRDQGLRGQGLRGNNKPTAWTRFKRAIGIKPRRRADGPNNAMFQV